MVLIHGLKDNVVKEDVPRKILKKVNIKNRMKKDKKLR